MKTTAPERTYTIEALLAEGFTRSALHKYTKRGILPHAHGGRGPSAFYSDVHIRVLRRLREMRDANRTLADFAEECHHDFPHAYKPAKKEDAHA